VSKEIALTARLAKARREQQLEACGGILIDIPRLKGVSYLEPGTPIYVEALEA
jgi:hypothetical protein